MTRSRLTLFLFLSLAVGAAFPARADIEFLQKIQEYLGVVQNNMSYVQGHMAQAQELKRSASEGVGNVMQKINEIKDDPLGSGEELLGTNMSEITDVNNIVKATEQVGKNYNAQIGQGNDVEVAREQHEKMMDIQRENLANFYSVAFTTRSLLAKERTKNEPDNDMKSTREIIKLSNKKAAEMARRLRNIMKIEAATYEFQTSQAAIAYSSEERKDDETSGGAE